MPPFTTHLVIGERVFPQLSQFEQEDYGGFLLGCGLVDVHGFSSIDRRTAHFADRLDKESAFALNRSCKNFMDQLDGLLIRPWEELTSTEQAFVTGCLCHLAADLESVLEIHRRLGKTEDEIRKLRHQHEAHWESAENIIEKHFGGIQPRVQAMV